MIPLLFSALVVGISEMGEIRSLKRVGLRTLAYTVIVSAVAVAVTWLAAPLVRMLWEFDQRSQAADLPLWIPQGLVPLGFALIALVTAARLLRK